MKKGLYLNRSSFISAMLLVCYLLLSVIGEGTSNVQYVSVLGLFLLIYIFVSWKRNYYRILSPYIVFIVLLYFTLCGQTIPWAIGWNAGFRDLTTVKYNSLTFDNSSICRALFFSYLCILMTHTVVLSCLDSATKRMKLGKKKTLTNSESTYYDLRDFKLYQVMIIVGILFSIVSIGPYLINARNQFVTIQLNGYGAQYSNVSYGMNSIIGKIGEFFPVGVVTLLYAWGHKNEYNKNNYWLKATVAYAMVILYLVMELMLSQRTGVMLFAIALLFIFFSDKEIPMHLIVIGGIGGLVLMAGMRMVDMIRNGYIQGLNDFITYSSIDSNNPVLDFLGDLGWNLMTTIEFQKVIPEVRPFGCGFTYLISLTSIIPNVNIWDIHPAALYGNISGWLQEYLNFSFGLGCTPVAEAYYNFGNFGWLVFGIWGKFIAYLTRKYEDKSSILNNYMVVLFMGIMLKSAVRSSFYALFRPYIFYVIIPVVMVKYLYKVFSR